MGRFLATAINWPQINDWLVINDAALSFSSFQSRYLALSIRLSPCLAHGSLGEVQCTCRCETNLSL